jgi:hypothetical protein
MRKQSRNILIRVLAMLLVVALSAPMGACRKKGPAERAGEEVDEAVEEIGDAINPKGPAEKAGRAIDKAVDDATD